MVYLLAALAIAGAEPNPAQTYAESINTTVNGAVPAWEKLHASSLKKLPPSIMTAELGVEASGHAKTLAIAVSSGNEEADDLLRHLILMAEPFEKAPGELVGPGEELTCLVRLGAFRSKRSTTLDVATGCLSPSDFKGYVGNITNSVKRGRDAGANLLRGWDQESRGSMNRALRFYKRANRQASQWDLAARSLGLALVAQKKVDNAIPYLKLYVEQRSPPSDVMAYAREIRRYEKHLEAKIAEENRVRSRLSKEDIGKGIRKGYALIEPCLRKARKARALAVGSDTLQLTFKINKDGSIATSDLEGPSHLVMTDHAECIARAVGTWRFPKYSDGSEVTVRKLPLKVRGSAPPPKTRTASSSSAPPPEPEDEELSFASCQRSSGEIGGYIRRAFPKLNACLRAERKRRPTSAFPDELPISFVVDTDGSVRSVAPGHRHFRDGSVGGCIKGALSGKLPPAAGADCPAEFSINLKGL